MPCHSAMMDKFVSVTPDQSVESVLALMHKKKADYLAVVDAKGILQGYLSYRTLLKSLIPVSVQLGGGKAGDIIVGAAPGIARRLRKVKPLQIAEIMERKINSVHPNTPVWEGVSLLVELGAPLFILEPESNKLIGVMDEESALAELERLQNESTGSDAENSARQE